MKLEVLVDNQSYADQFYLAEPGLSYYIEIDKQKILFDTGYSDIIIRNAKEMGIDLAELNYIVLSHGHNGHTNGLKYLFAHFNLSKAQLVCHPGCFQLKQLGIHNIGAPFTEDVVKQQIQYHPTKRPYYLSDNCIFLGEIPTIHPFEPRRPMGKTIINGKESEDLIMDDSALVCLTKTGLLIAVGCAHSGICNIVSYAQQVTGIQKIAAIIGGFHLAEDDPRLPDVIKFFKSQPIDKLYPCHCVSLQAKADMLRAGLPVERVGVGLKIDL